MDPRMDALWAYLQQAYGLGPTTAATRGGLPNAALSQGPQTMGQRAAGAIMDYGPIPAQMAAGVLMQPATAGAALGEAAANPSLANWTNAALQAGLALPSGRALKAGLSAGGLGFGAAAASDIGLLGSMDTAEAAPKKKETAAVPDAPQGLDPQQAKRWQELTAKQTRDGWLPPAERDELKGINSAISTAFAARGVESARTEAEAKRAKQMEYDRATKYAEGQRDKELGRRTTFQDTEVGKVWERTGGLAPFIAGIGGGALARAVGGVPQTAMQRYGVPAIEGAGAAFGANNVPLLYDAFLTPSENPEKRAYEVYGRELPAGHEAKQQALDYAATLDADNPTRGTAQREFANGMPSRLLASFAEGAPAGIAGSLLAGVPRAAATGAVDALSGAASVPGKVLSSYHRSMAEADAAAAARRAQTATGTGPGGSTPGGQNPAAALRDTVPQPIPQQSPPVPPQASRSRGSGSGAASGPYDASTHGQISMGYLSELLASGQALPDAVALRKALTDRYAAAGLPAVRSSDATKRAGSTLHGLSEGKSLLEAAGIDPSRVQNDSLLREALIKSATGGSGLLGLFGLPVDWRGEEMSGVWR